VLAVVYAVFTEGYAATSDPGLVRVDVAEEAIRLARLLVRLMPSEPEPAGLLALLLHHARRATRLDPGGAVVLLPEQDRSRWDRAMIIEGVAVLEGAVRRGAPGSYQLQAAIAAVHAERAGG
jgi:RNA polymerase sigma-70 factor (ECF subfamily)